MLLHNLPDFLRKISKPPVCEINIKIKNNCVVCFYSELLTVLCSSPSLLSNTTRPTASVHQQNSNAVANGSCVTELATMHLHASMM